MLHLHHLNNFKSTKEYCIKYNYSGITFENEIYQIRSGKYINYFESEKLISWIYM